MSSWNESRIISHYNEAPSPDEVVGFFVYIKIPLSDKTERYNVDNVWITWGVDSREELQ